DYIKSIYMIALGLFISGLASIFLPDFSRSILTTNILYGIMGFALAMIYAPLTKLIAENTSQNHAVRCTLFLNFAAYFGAPIASGLALIFIWKNVFKISGIILIVMAILSFAVFSYLEFKKIIKFKKIDKRKSDKSGYKVLIKRDIVRFTFVSILTGVIRTTVLFWLPTYLMEYLSFSEDKSNTFNIIITFLISLASFAAVSIYKMFKENMSKTLLFAFSVAAFFFGLCAFINQAYINIFVLLVAIISSNCAATMLWSVYCPSLSDTGLVSSATGYLDFVSYMSAAIASKLFGNAVSNIGWNGLIFVWVVLMIIGIIISLPIKKRCEA
ncbi:MAG: MFS transporter, partial [Clostridia bacterium]|nr:MFS transporter [Clostridia bacterium]